VSSPQLTHALRELVWSLESEVAVISSLSRQIDDHVAVLNAARAELVERLTRLDALVDAADEPELQAVLRSYVAAPLPLEDESFPERLYG
jgi:hypothetical protein